MLYPEISKLMKGMESRYSLVIATAKRARQLAADSSEDKPVSRAVAEIAAGKIKCVKPGQQKANEQEQEAAEEAVNEPEEAAGEDGVIE